jgi:hypothetical protein
MIAYMIMTSAEQYNVRRLINWIYHPNNLYYVSIDKNLDLTADIGTLGAGAPENIRFRSPLPVVWGGISQVRVTIEAIRAMLEMDSGWEYFVNLSDTDVPLKSQEQIFSILRRRAENEEKNFLKFWQHTSPIKYPLLDDSVPPNWKEMLPFRNDVRFLVHSQCQSMFSHVSWSPVMKPHLRLAVHVDEKLDPKTLQVSPCRNEEALARQDLFQEHAPSFGKLWSVLHRDTCEWLVSSSLIERFLNVFSTTFCPDESMLHTLLATNKAFKAHTVRDSLRFASGQPVTVNDTILPRLRASEALFARKLKKTKVDSTLHWLNSLAHEKGQAVF